MTDPRHYTPEDLDEMHKEDLETIADARGLQVTGSGADGNVLVEDLHHAILAHQDQAGINPALEPIAQPDEPIERTYRVVGPHTVHNTAPGSQFTAALAPTQEAHLIEGGHIIRITQHTSGG